MASYRKTKAGEWVVFGAVDEIIAGEAVQVCTKRGDVKTETVVRTGQPFDVNGTSHVYGYIAQRKPQSRRKDYPGMECPACESEPLNNQLECWECGYQGR